MAKSTPGIRRLAPNRYQIRVSLGWNPATSTYHEATRVIHGTLSDAKKARAALLTEVSSGSHISPTWTFAQLTADWWRVSSPNLSPKTAHEYRRLLDRRILPTFGSLPLRKLGTYELDAFYASLLPTLSPLSIRHVHALIHRIMAQGVRWGRIPSNPASLTTLPPIPPRESTPPTPDKIRAIIAAPLRSGDEMWAAMIWVAASCGLRRGELAALRWCDISTKDRILSVRGSLSSVTLERQSPKWGSARPIPFSDHLDRVLQSLPRAAVMAPVFSPAPPSPYRPDSLTQSFRRAANSLGSGYESIRLHDMRHFMVSQLLANDVDVATVARRAGHQLKGAGVPTTLSVYAGRVTSADRRAAEVIEGIIADQD